MPPTRKTNGRKKAGKKEAKAPLKALPVTLLSGFLGAGKTTLLQHILRSDHGLRIAVIVNDIGAVNVDASLIKQTHTLTKTSEKVIALQNGCICCTLRGDLLEELVRLSQLQQFDYIVIESSGISEPEQVAETFDERLAEQMGGFEEDGMGLDEETRKALASIKKAGGLDKFAKLDTTVTVIDAFTMLNDFDTADLLSNRRDDVTPEDERTVSDLMVDQIEFADVIILNKMDLVDESAKTQIKTLITSLNHRAKILTSSYGKVPVTEIVNTGLFNLEVAQTGYGWLQDLHDMTLREVNGKKVVTPKPETEEYNVGSFVYTRYRPFHPKRLWELVYDKFILQMEHEDDEDDEMEEDEDEEEQDAEMADEGDEAPQLQAMGQDGMSDSDSDQTEDARSSSPRSSRTAASSAATDDSCKPDVDDDLDIPSNAAILETRRSHPIISRLFRSKGEYHLATRPHRAGEWSQAGAMLTLKGGRQWFVTLPEEEYTTGNPEIDSLVQHDIQKGGKWGDRRQELVFIGEHLRKKQVELEAMLDKCLLDDEEYAQWEEVMGKEYESDEKRREALEDLFDDGFPDWPGDDEDEHDHEGHDHGNGVRSLKAHMHGLEEVS